MFTVKVTRRKFALVYAGSIMASVATMARRKDSPVAGGLSVVEVNTAGGPGQVRLAYLDSAPGTVKPVVILIHGSPGTGDVLHKLAALLPVTFRVIVPDLPGFGSSSRDIPDYSFRAHAHYMLELMDALGIRAAQVLGFSMGGGVALSMVDLAPERLSSLVMLSAIGIQEHELTGRYWLNHAIHGLQLAALRTLRLVVPHFGWLDDIPFNISYARNFFDSDQRPLRAVLSRYKGPMLIIHGTKDPLVPLSAALEHHRLVPQSELLLLPSDHFMAFLEPDLFKDRLIDFLQRWDGAGTK
ncbi:MAG: alpha/beta hydrolase [Bryobacteraceae bacterium]